MINDWLGFSLNRLDWASKQKIVAGKKAGPVFEASMPSVVRQVADGYVLRLDGAQVCREEQVEEVLG